MKNLIIDIEKHCPTSERIFSPADYYSPHIPLDQMTCLQVIPDSKYCEEQYGIIPVLNWNDLDDSYDNVIFIWPVHSFNDDGYITNTEERRNFFIDLYKKLSEKNINRYIYIDGGDRAIVKIGMEWLDSNNLKCDYVFKREFRKQFLEDYDHRVIPYPFTVFGKPNPPFLLYENTKNYKIDTKINECMWAGSPIFANSYIDEMCDRESILFKIYSHLSIKSNLSHETFLKEISNHKFFLHLNGTGHLCKRFFEGLSTGSLMIMQKTDLVFPFDETDYFSEETIFSTPEEFITKLNRLKYDHNLYEKCLQNQNYIVSKYFNYDWIRKYIFSKIN